jgi:hypothetical protein
MSLFETPGSSPGTYTEPVTQNVTPARDYIRSAQQTIEGQREIIGYGEPSFFVKEIDRDRANKIIIKNHYSGKIYSGTFIHLGLFIDRKLLGVIQLGYAMNPASAGSVVETTKMDEYLELNRMWMDDAAGRNTESRALSYAIKYIRGKFRKIKWIQSFADERCGMFGIVYQASNFRYYGEHTNIFWELDGVMYHNVIMTNGSDQSANARRLRQRKDDAVKHELRQFRYIYFIDQRYIKKTLLKEKPYPKHYAERGGKTGAVAPIDKGK